MRPCGVLLRISHASSKAPNDMSWLQPHVETTASHISRQGMVRLDALRIVGRASARAAKLDLPAIWAASTLTNAGNRADSTLR